MKRPDKSLLKVFGLCVLLFSYHTYAVNDSDGDGIEDYRDNCRLVSNPDQRDTNQDGFGNRCDGDLKADGIIDWEDVNRSYWYYGQEGESDYNPDADINGDGIVNNTDTALIYEMMQGLGVPGPGALPSGNENSPPLIISIESLSVEQGATIAYQVQASEPDGDQMYFSLQISPDWLTINELSGELIGNTTGVNPGVYEANVQVSDGNLFSSASFQLEVVAKDAGAALDSDGDGVEDKLDNCIFVANPMQRDSNNNLYGNFCDGDLTGDGVVTWDDINRSYWYYGDYNPDADINGDNVVDGQDTSLIHQMMTNGGELGPSGLIENQNTPPSVLASTLNYAVVGKAYLVNVSVTDAEDDTLAFVPVNFPSWLSFNLTTRVIEGTPTSQDIGRFENISLNVSDGVNTVSIAPFDIHVTETPLDSCETNTELCNDEVSIPSGVNIYYMATTGVDNMQCSYDAPCRTFPYTVAKLAPGDELKLFDGNYSLADHGGLDPVDNSGATIANSVYVQSGISIGQPTIISAVNRGNVSLESGIQIGSTAVKQRFIFVHGITFHGGGQIYNGDHNVFKNSGFEGGLSVGTIDHSDGNRFNLIEDVWIWSKNVRITAGNYRAHHNTWRRVLIRDDGCDLENCGEKSGNNSVGISVYNSHHVLLENVIVIDRVLGRNPYGYADFASAQHDSNQAAQEEGELLGNNRWLGCMSINSEDNAMNFEADAVMDGDTGVIRDFSALKVSGGAFIDIAHRPYSGYSYFDVSAVKVYAREGSDSRFIIGCDVVNSSDPGCAHNIQNNSSGRYSSGLANLLPQLRVGTNRPLWPWPNQETIKKDMCEKEPRGFCQGSQSLTDYVLSH